MAALLRLLAIGASTVVAIAFLIFATEEMDRGSKTQQRALGNETGVQSQVLPPAPTPQDEAIRERQHGKVREGIEDANDVLLAPFSGVVADSSNNWVGHGVPALLALLVYGVGLGLVANLLPQGRTHAGDWRTAES